ncbi:TonB-dependent receptor [Sphingobium sp. CFD-1]|uniref:TonB-dependent receptor n=1 Tax=Sphingobium sp. CFD-1 TaxID=2878545 RepID=UPI00214BCF37|nr:TonB-dependent receptor [Sphingobium sp. CFD-1]
MGFASALLLLAEAGGHSPPAQGRDTVYRIDIAAGPLSVSLARFSEITGISVGLPGDMPRISTRRVAGIMSPDAALRHLLEGSGWRARRMGDIYRIVAEAPEKRAPRPASAPVPPSSVGPLPDIIVTAQKRPQILTSVPLSVSIISLGPLASGSRTLSSRDISFGTEGLAMTNLGPGRNRQFIRGVADSPFNGQSQSTVAVQVDEARVTFDAPDPDLRLIDVDRVEILKGPQGPLYGSGALGGIYHIVTRRPELDRTSLSVRLSTEGVQHGGIGTGLEGVINVPLVEDRLAFRAVGYRLINAGWIDNRDGRTDSNSVETVGLRLGLRGRPADGWTVDGGIALQDINARDSQYVVAGAKMLERTNRIAEPTDNDFKMAHLAVEGNLRGMRLVSATSYVDHGFDYTLDASSAAASFGLTGAARFNDSRAYTLFNQELRLSSDGVNHWLAGASFLRATTQGISTITGEDDAPQVVEALDRRTTEYAIFGEGTWRLFATVDATLGVRLSHSVSEDEASQQSGQRALKRGKTILSPSAALSLPLHGQGILYLRYARAMRPGGLAPSGMTLSGRFDADELSTVDLGFRQASADGHVSLSASTYYTRWNEIQSDYLLPNGLVSTRNAGRGRIYGVEASLDWNLGAGFSLSAGGTAQSARLTHMSDGTELDDRRLPVTPGLNGRLSLAKTIAVARWRGQASIQANYIGGARLSFDSDLDQKMGEYTVLGTHAELARGAWTVGARLDNLLDIKGDSFAFGNPFSIRKGQQFTPVRPRTLTLSIARSW